jgi:hypothetical protein
MDISNLFVAETSVVCQWTLNEGERKKLGEPTNNVRGTGFVLLLSSISNAGNRVSLLFLTSHKKREI